jgi:hypothetical protein
LGGIYLNRCTTQISEKTKIPSAIEDNKEGINRINPPESPFFKGGHVTGNKI